MSSASIGNISICDRAPMIVLTAARSWIAAVRFDAIDICDDAESERDARTSLLDRPPFAPPLPELVLVLVLVVLVILVAVVGVDTGVPKAATEAGIGGTGGTSSCEYPFAALPGRLPDDAFMEDRKVPTAPSDWERVSGLLVAGTDEPGLVGEPEVDCRALLVLLLLDFLRFTGPLKVARDISPCASAS